MNHRNKLGSIKRRGYKEGKEQRIEQRKRKNKRLLRLLTSGPAGTILLERKILVS